MKKRGELKPNRLKGKYLCHHLKKGFLFPVVMTGLSDNYCTGGSEIFNIGTNG